MKHFVARPAKQLFSACGQCFDRVGCRALITIQAGNGQDLRGPLHVERVNASFIDAFSDRDDAMPFDHDRGSVTQTLSEGGAFFVVQNVNRPRKDWRPATEYRAQDLLPVGPGEPPWQL